MPSSYKTTRLALNRWIGSDKPKKDDFNADNEILDNAFATLQSRVEGLEEQPEDCPAAQAAGAAVQAHVSNANAHVSAAERAAWNSPQQGGPVVGTYVGNGASSRKVSLGFRPRAGFLFGMNQGPVDAYWNGQENQYHFGFFSDAGGSRLLSVYADGIEVKHHSGRQMDGNTHKLNETDITYIYVAWK